MDPKEAGAQAGPEVKEKWADVTDEPDVSQLKISDGTEEEETPVPVKPKSEELIEKADAKIEKELVEGSGLYSSAKTFDELNLSEPLLRGLYSEMKFERPSKIQAETLPLIMNPPHRNLVAQAHNGSGKTTCFVLGMLSRVDPTLNEPQALCVCPTRELALQNQKVLEKMAKFTNITSVTVIPSAQGNARSTLRGPVHDQVVIGTAGILERWIKEFRILNLQHLKILVFDEADLMLDQSGFRSFSMFLLRKIERTNCQILLFSATFNEKVRNFVSKNIKIANRVYVEKDEELSLDVISQYRVKCPSVDAKFEVLRDRIYPIAEKLGQSIIFADTRTSVRTLHERLENEGYKCSAIEGGMRPEDRDKVIEEFRKGVTRILIATNVLARGFDVAQVTLVVNLDVPLRSDDRSPDYETYLHRIGRSGRFGRKGAAFNLLYGKDEEDDLNRIEQHFGRVIPPVAWDNVEEFEKVLKDAGLR